MTETESAPHTHPELRAWLRTRADRFERWAREGGGAARWDFAPESLHALEVLVRQRFSGPEEIAAARSGEFVQGAVWYVCEVIRRAFPRWRYDPFTSEGRAPERMFEPGVLEVGDRRIWAGRTSGTATSCIRWGRSTGCSRGPDELDNPVDAHLVDVLDVMAGEDEE